jgi:hypothetical protein
MATNLFERLAEMDVPPPPAQFDAQLHDRVNRSLVTWQLVDLLVRGMSDRMSTRNCGGMPWALGHFAQAMVGCVAFTLTGRYETKTKNGPRR